MSCVIDAPLVLTGTDLAGAIQSNVAPSGAPFSDWVPKLIEGWRFQPVDNDDTIRIFKAWLGVEDPCVVSCVMDILRDVAFDNYGDSNE